MNNTLKIALLASITFAMQAQAQQVDTLDFVIQGQELMYGDGAIDADNIIVNEAINFSLSGNTDFSASALQSYGLKAQNHSSYGLPNLGFTFTLPGIDLSPIGGPNWSLGTWGIETVANAYAGVKLLARTHVEDSEVRVDYPFDLRVKIPAYNRGDLVTIEVEGRPKADLQSDVSRFIELVTPNLEKSIENAFGVGAEVGLDIYLGPFTNNSSWDYRLVDFNIHDEWTVLRAAPDGFYGGLGMIARPELSALNHNLMSAATGVQNLAASTLEDALNEVATGINSAMPDFSFSASPSPIDGAIEFMNCFVEPDWDLTWSFAPEVPGASFDQWEYPDMTFQVGPYSQANFELAGSPAFYFYEDEAGDSIYYSNLCMNQMPLIGSLDTMIKIPSGSSNRNNRTQQTKTSGRLTKRGTKPKSKKVPAWMLFCTPTLPDVFTGLLPSGTSTSLLGQSVGLSQQFSSTTGLDVPGFMPFAPSTTPWFTTAPQLDLNDFYGFSMTLRNPQSDLLSVPEIGSDFGLHALTTNNTSWFELRHNYFDTFEAVLENYCPLPILPTPQCISLAAIDMRKSEDNTLLQLAGLADSDGRISIWKLSTGSLGFLNSVVNAVDAVNCATESVGSTPPGINNSIINFANWGLANLSDLRLLDIWMEYNLFDVENKFSISNAFELDYSPEVQLSLAFKDSTGNAIARDVILQDGTVVEDATSITLGLNEEFQIQTECDDHHVEFHPTITIVEDPIDVTGEDIFADSLYLKLFNFDAGIEGVTIIPSFGFDFPCVGSIGEFAESLGSCAAYAIEKFGCTVLSWFGVKCKTRTKCKTCHYGFPGLKTPSWSIAKNIGQIGLDRSYNLGTASLDYAPESTYELSSTGVYRYEPTAEFMGGATTFDPIVMEARLFGLRGVEVRRWADRFEGENGNILIDAEIDGIVDPILVSFDEVAGGEVATSLQQYMSDAQSILVRQGRYENFNLSNAAGCPADRLEEGGLSTLDSPQVVSYIPAEKADFCSDDDNDKCNDCASGSYDPMNDGQDSDGDGLCDYGDTDDDNDGIEDANDSFPFNAALCGDKNNDGCDDCDNALDYDGDGLCDSSASELDTDNDGRSNAVETAMGADTMNPRECGDLDGDGCDDCTYAFDAWWTTHGSGDFDADALTVAIRPDLSGWDGFAQPRNDGPDFDHDGLCDSGDPDDDNDGVADGQDDSPKNPSHCQDLDGDGCNDCRLHWKIYFESRYGEWTGDQLTDAEFATAWGDLDSLRLPNLDEQFIGGYASTTDDGETDFDGDGICDETDPDRDNDGVLNAVDFPLGVSGAVDATRDSLLCADADADLCDDCSQGLGADPSNDGADFDGDGLCDKGDLDDDNDGVLDVNDIAPLDSLRCADVDLDGCDDCASGTFDPLRDGPNFDWVASLTDPAYDDAAADSLADYRLEVWNDGANQRLDSIRFLWVNTGVPGAGYWRDLGGFVTDASGNFDPTGTLSGSNTWMHNGVTFRLDTVDAGDHDSDGDGVPEILLVTEHIRPVDGAPVIHAIEAKDSLAAGSNFLSCAGDFVGIIVPEDETLNPDTVCGMGRRIKDVLDADPTQGLFVRYTAWHNGVGSDVSEQFNAYDGIHSYVADEPVYWYETDQIPSVDSLTSLVDTLTIASGDYYIVVREIPLDQDDYDASVCLDHDGDGCDDCAYNFGNGDYYEVTDVTPASGGYWDENNDGPDYDGDGICDDGDDDDDNDGVLDANEAAGEAQNPAACGDSDSDTCDDCEHAFGLWWADHGTGTFDATNPGIALNPDSTYFQPSYDGPDSDSDGLCDAGDNCSDLAALNYDDPSNATCVYPPTVATQTANLVMWDRSMVHGNVSDDGGSTITHYGVKWGTDPTMATADSIGSTGIATVWSDTLTGLTANTTYYFVAFASHSLATAYGDTLSFTSLADPCGGTTSITYDGHAYDLVGIGNQCWFAENLRSTKYNDGSVIPTGLSDASWQATNLTSLGASAVYGDGTSACTGACDEGQNLSIYGRLYNWYAVNTGMLCPSGWHVPSDAEWTVLTNLLGQDPGSMLKSLNWDGDDYIGLSLLPGGYRYHSGLFSSAGVHAYMWSSSPGGASAWDRRFYTNLDTFDRISSNRRNGFSVRCVQD